jgi:hypothetical protein
MDDVRFQTELRRVWDEIARGEPATSGELDPQLVETIQRLHTLGDVPPPDPIYTRRLQESLMHTTAMPLPLADPLAQPDRNGQWPPTARPAIRPPLPQVQGRSAVIQLATAALLLLTLVGSLLAFGSGRLGQRDTPAFLPAIGGTPAAPETVTTKTLLDASTGSLPSGPGIVVFKRLTLQPSPKSLVVLPLTGPVFIMVETGELTATAAGTEHRLAAGDSFSPIESEQEVALRATGAEEAVAFLVYFQSGPDHPFPRDPIVHKLEVLIDGSTDGLVGCPCRVLLEQLTLPAGRALPPQEASRWTWLTRDKGVLGVILEGEHLPFRFKTGEERTFELGQYLPIDLIQPGTRMTLRNAGGDPLVLYRLVLAPGAAGATVPGSPVP